MSMEDDLSTEIIQWLNGMSGYETIFSEGLLIIPIAKYFRDQGFDVNGDTDYYFHRSDKKSGERGKANYDFYAKNGDSETIILEMKWLKAEFKKEGSDYSKRGNANYPRIITDFIKLAIPPVNLWKRLVVVARDPDLPSHNYTWFKQLMGGDKLELMVVRNDTLNIKCPGEERERIFDLLEAYKIPSLELVITPHTPAISNGSVEVLVFSVERK